MFTPAYLPCPKGTTRAEDKAARDRAADKQWLAVCKVVDKRDGGKCRVCRRKCSPTALGMTDHAERHHIIPRSQCGPDASFNLATLCFACHAARHTHGTLRLSGDGDERDPINSQVEWPDRGEAARRPLESGEAHMTLWDAIRLGSMVTKPLTGSLVNMDATRTCALGAACVAAGIPISFHSSYDSIIARWPDVNRFVSHPASGRRRELLGVIASLNDQYDWTREQIADWGETLERAREAETQPLAEHVTA